MDPASAPPLAPSRTRFGVLYFGIALAVIQYIDRVCIAQAIPDIRNDLGITGPEYDNYVGYVFSAFALAYALFEVPTGWLGDRFGGRHLLTMLVLGWSLLTGAVALTALVPAGVWPFILLLVLRFLFGMLQAGGFPVWARVIADWMPVQERGLAQGRAEKRHAPGHHEVTQPAENRREHEDAEETTDEKRILEI